MNNTAVKRWACANGSILAGRAPNLKGNIRKLTDLNFATIRKKIIDEVSKGFRKNSNFSLSNFSFLSVRKDSGVAKKTPPSAKQHYMKQARYFPGQTTTNQPRVLHNPAASTYPRKPSYGMTGNAVGGTTYVPSFAGGGQTRAGGVGGK